MRALIQRVKGKTLIVSRVDGAVVSQASFEGPGFVVLLGWLQSDEPAQIATKEEWILSRVEGLRVFPDAQGRMNLNLADYMTQSQQSSGGILWVSQFTLAAELKSGFRPSFTAALAPDVARARYETMREKLRAQPRPYSQIFGEFGADMELSFTNWGPVTIPLESALSPKPL